MILTDKTNAYNEVNPSITEFTFAATRSTILITDSMCGLTEKCQSFLFTRVCLMHHG